MEHIDVEAAAKAYAIANPKPDLSRDQAVILAFIKGAMFGISDLTARTHTRDAIGRAADQARRAG